MVSCFWWWCCCFKFNVFTWHFKKLARLYQLPKVINIRKLGSSALK